MRPFERRSLMATDSICVSVEEFWIGRTPVAIDRVLTRTYPLTRVARQGALTACGLLQRVFWGSRRVSLGL